MTLSQFSAFIGKALTREPVLLGAWVTAELSDLSTSGGHCYMTLIEKDAAGVTVARMRATIWASRYAYIRRKFFAATGRELASGMKVMLYGGANYHGNYGLSFNVGEIDPAYTMGDLERLRREILERLRLEGVFDLNRTRPMPEPPQRVAIISSEKAAGYGDFINQLHANAAGAVFYTCLFPSVMQGDRTAAGVIQALDLVEQTRSIIPWDCVAIIRGGGATTDMNGFDNLELARRVATFPLPVIVGIGHERDRCVLDEIAAVRCKTPTAVAAWLTDRVGFEWQRASDLAQRVASYASERVKGEGMRLQGIESLLPAVASNRIRSAQLRLQTLSGRLPIIARSATSAARVKLEKFSTLLRFASTSRIEKELASLDSIGKLLEVLDPAATLRRGYSITRVNGHAVTDTAELNEGDIVETTLASGSFTSTLSQLTTQSSKLL